MKKLIFLFWLAINGPLFGQMLEGPLLDEGRKSISPIQYVHKGSVHGWMKAELSVDREGKVTSVRQLETNIKSTPTRVRLKNYLLSLRFEEGTYFPKFHHVILRLTSVPSQASP